MSHARYVFEIRVRPESTRDDLTLSPAEMSVKLYKDAAQPGEDGWLFFRDYLWRGKLNETAPFRSDLEAAYSLRVVSVEFKGLQTSTAYLDALKDEIHGHLDLFNADTVDEVLNKYLGSSIQVT
ncbi:LWR-salt protein [Haladaptatus sp. DJG-WS-42]|uniref:LWR-salt protein n=1 Tax=Haladaptatus sp. DJG-WS-42 TaxID=3120516 RepID=UPI0030CB5F4A